LSVSTDGSGGSWTNLPWSVREPDGTNVTLVNSPIIRIGPNHIAYAFWLERTGTTTFTNWLKMRQVRERGATLGDVHVVRQLVTTDAINGNLALKRSNTAEASDTFRVFPFPVPAVNPTTTNYLYVAYADKGENSGDNADIFFVYSTDGGTNWTNPLRVNTVWTNDQWMPLLAVNPDGTKLFIGWYDRRNDTNNSLIDLYGRWGTIASNGDVTLGTEFRITTTNFPPVFGGTLGDNKTDGHYDPVYPPVGVNLHWWYSDWPPPPPPPDPDPNITPVGAYEGHVGEYNGTWAEAQYVYMTWADNRLMSGGTLYGRNQPDIRMVRLSWPK
jgi:hypothetical protein